MKGFLDGVGRAAQQALSILASPFVQLSILGVVGLLIWRKIFGGQSTVADVVGNTIDSAATIPSGLSSLIESKLQGQSEGTYITAEEQRRQAQENLLAHQAGGL